MREIKFRAWDLDNKEWIGNGDPMDLHYSGRANCFLFDNDHYDIPKNVIWVQYTGLKDKNGKEIYEGDILKSIFPAGYSISVVKFGLHDNGLDYEDRIIGNGWYIVKRIIGKNVNDDSIYQLNPDCCPFNCHGFKIIGNIYENPELIKERGNEGN